MLKQLFLPIGLIVLILTVNTMRFINLETIPYGFQVDEQTSGVTLACLAEKGIAPLNDEKYPLFGNLSFASPKPPTYMYPGMLWVKLFGYSPAAMRGLTAFAFIIGLLGLFAIGRHLGKGRCGLWIMLAASFSPWTWTMSRIAWESLFVLPFLIWGIFISLRAKKTWHFILAGALFSGAVYTYPAARLQMPLLLLVLFFYGRKQLNWRLPQIIWLLSAFLITSIPLLLAFMKMPQIFMRFKEISIANPEYLQSIGKSGSILDLLGIAFSNFIAHAKPEFLFFKGTPQNLTLTTGRQGIMSWLDIVAFMAGISYLMRAWKHKKPVGRTTAWLMGFLAVNIIIGILPTTLTTTDIPHNLRSIGAWPFAMIATGLIVHKATEKDQWLWIGALGVSAAFAFIFLTQYFKLYPKDSIGMFGAWTLEEAKQARTDQAWMEFLYRYHPHMFTSRYYLMRYHGDNCLQARTTWEKLYPMFKKLAEQNQPKEKQ